MAPVLPPAKALVTGANGYVAAWVTRALLDAGYSVRGTVRTSPKGEQLKAAFKSYGDKLEYIVVEDMMQGGAFDEAVKGIDIVHHVASPTALQLNDPDDFIVPALKGTVGVLESIRQTGSSVKRFVYTSSCATIQNYTGGGPFLFDETSWNEPVLKELEEKGKATPGLSAYRASKTLAEKAVWNFYEKHKESIDWDVVTLCPCYVFGVPAIEPASPAELSASMQVFYSITLGQKEHGGLGDGGNSWVDVRDVGTAHALASHATGAGNQRIIVSHGGFFWQDLWDSANAIAPTSLTSIPKGEPGSTKGKVPFIAYSRAKMDSVLGLKTRPLDDMVKECLDLYVKLQGK
ncbi:NAD-P-binding protein [Gloeopeniophorella convolvens]|nr:NAD-P-binding protein [Gloeopeniophorella convolvens]